ncbi:movement protein [Eragrostis streak virus]|uniref:Movement protein n=1 Tax=Eragrostis streak virus TaxID=496807 RepID=B0Z3X6_9GEMI|nr:movement protein [Eragrostis streak virus]ABZ03980.1 movement protein [Eragrostis streak virus]
MESFEGAGSFVPQVALPRVPPAAPSVPSLPWSSVGEIAIFIFVAVLALYLLWIWVVRDCLFVVKARQGGSTEELQFGPRERPPVPAGDRPPLPPAVSVATTSETRPFSV